MSIIWAPSLKVSPQNFTIPILKRLQHVTLSTTQSYYCATPIAVSTLFCLNNCLRLENETDIEYYYAILKLCQRVNPKMSQRDIFHHVYSGLNSAALEYIIQHNCDGPEYKKNNSWSCMKNLKFKHNNVQEDDYGTELKTQFYTTNFVTPNGRSGTLTLPYNVV